MTEEVISYPLIVLIMGLLLVLMICIKSAFQHISIPALVGFIVLGFLVRLFDMETHMLTASAYEIFEFLAHVGIFVLLFRIGLESDIRGLLHQLKRASFIWIGGVAISAMIGYLAAYYLIDLGFIPSLIIACAMTATSVGVAVGVWKEADALKSKKGELLLDVAEMDDISGIIIMVILFSILPILRHGGDGSIALLAGKEMLIIIGKLILFGGLCALFSLYLEKKVSHFFKGLPSSPNPILVITGIGFILASLAGILGFSIAIGAFFAGLAFSRDPESVKIDTSFGMIYALFSPFFFIGVGINIAPESLGAAIVPGTILALAAIVGKLLGHGSPALATGGWVGAAMIGVSMIPRAEITMIIMQRGLKLGEWAISSQVFTSMVIVSAVTCILAPIVVRNMLNRWPQKEEA